ncbi:MAG: response regulator [Bacteroidetes bacterium]|nr:response regulator [Bacteroidota bacterium]
MRVLIADDIALNREVYRSILEAELFLDISEAADGNAAVRMLNNAGSYPFDLVITDVDMPEMDGLQLSRYIRETETLKDTQILVITALKEDRVLQESFEIGVTDFISQPVQPLELLVRVKAALRLKQEVGYHGKKIAELQDAISRVHTLSGLLPICAGCKKIKDDHGYWKQVESYIESHTHATFTHGICPACTEKLYGSLLKENDTP